MEITQTRVVPAAPDRVWAALNDPDVLKACVPGCEAFERTGENGYRATVAAKIGPVAARFHGKLELADVTPPTGYTLKFEGQGGAAGFANGSARVSLAPAEAGGTALTYAVKAQVGGKLAQIGNRLVDGAAAKLADDFFARFSEAVAPKPVAAEVAVAAPAALPEGAGGGDFLSRHLIRIIAIAAIVGILVYLYARTAR
ncbi:MAG TPA: carbon monoxide dehydrogenase subunit G [Casimicrobiaceae bacterium]|nr:carbon monoxide dehydrogenase subunit G [Casimicrobiaceae bacterium]